MRAVPAHQLSPTALFTLWGTTRGRALGSSGRLGNARWADGRPAFARTDLPGRWVGQGVNGQRPRCLRAASDRRRGPLAALPGQDGVAEGCDGRPQSCAAPTIAVRRRARPMQIAHGVPGNGPQARNRCARLCGARCTGKQENRGLRKTDNSEIEGNIFALSVAQYMKLNYFDVQRDRRPAQ